jgi:uncharacterized protein YndB with AHSA1/START domain
VSRPDKVRVTTFVDVASADAFEVFTAEIDAWWGRGPRFRFGGKGAGVLRFEGGTRGRLVEAFADGTEFEVGKVLAWEPGARVAFEWRSPTFRAGERTEVEVTFAGKNGGTEVVVEHRGWAAVPDDHPVRHGNIGGAFTGMLGRFWGDLATSYRLFVQSEKR